MTFCLFKTIYSLSAVEFYILINGTPYSHLHLKNMVWKGLNLFNILQNKSKNKVSLFCKASLSQSTVTCTNAMLPKLEIMNSIFIFPKPERFLGQGEVKRSLSQVWIWRQETQGVSVFTYCLNIPGVSGGCKQRISCYNNRCRPAMLWVFLGGGSGVSWLSRWQICCVAVCLQFLCLWEEHC